MEERLKICCSECDAVIATVPKDRSNMGDLTCPNCGAQLRQADLIEKAVETVKDAISEITHSVKKNT
jgi:transcription initiation factor IIE alpha subunit